MKGFIGWAFFFVAFYVDLYLALLIILWLVLIIKIFLDVICESGIGIRPAHRKIDFIVLLSKVILEIEGGIESIIFKFLREVALVSKNILAAFEPAFLLFLPLIHRKYWYLHSVFKHRRAFYQIHNMKSYCPDSTV